MNSKSKHYHSREQMKEKELKHRKDSGKDRKAHGLTNGHFSSPAKSASTKFTVTSSSSSSPSKSSSRDRSARDRHDRTISTSSPLKSSKKSTTTTKECSPERTILLNGKSKKGKDKEKDQKRRRSADSEEREVVKERKRKEKRDTFSPVRNGNSAKNSSKSNSSSPTKVASPSKSSHRNHESSHRSHSSTAASTSHHKKSLDSPRATTSRHSSPPVSSKSPHKSSSSSPNKQSKDSLKESSTSSPGKKPRQHQREPSPEEEIPPPPRITAIKGPKRSLYPDGYTNHLNGLAKCSPESLPLWLPKRYVEDEEYIKETREANAKHYNKCSDTCNNLLFEDMVSLQYLLERHCVATENKRFRLRAEKRAFLKFCKETITEQGKVKKGKKDSVAWFLNHFEPPTRRTGLANGHSGALANSSISSNRRRLNSDEGAGSSGIEFISRVENNYTPKSSLLLTTIASSSVLATSPYLTDKVRRKAEKSKNLLVIVPAANPSHLYCSEKNQSFEQLIRDFDRVFGRDLEKNKHFEPLAEYARKQKFSDIVYELLEGKTVEAEEEKEVKRSSSRIRRNHSIDEMPPSPVTPKSASKRSRKELPADVLASPKPKNGFKIPRINGCLRPKSPISVVSSSQESSPRASPRDPIDSQPPSPSQLIKDMFDFCAPMTRRQVKNLQDTARAITKDAEASKRANSRHSAKSSKQTETVVRQPEDPYCIADRKLKLNMESNLEMLALLNDHVFLFGPQCFGCTADAIPVAATQDTGQEESKPLKPKKRGRKAKTATTSTSASSSTSTSETSSSSKVPLVSSFTLPTNLPPLPPPLPSPITFPLTRSRKRSHTDSVDTQPDTPTFSYFSRSQEVDAVEVNDAAYDYDAPNTCESREARGVPFPELEDELGIDSDSWCPNASAQEQLRPPRKEQLDALLAKAADKLVIKEGTLKINHDEPVQVSGPLEALQEEAEMKFFPGVNEEAPFLKHDPFGILDDSKWIESAELKRRFSVDQTESLETKEDDDPSRPPKDEVTESIKFLCEELSDITDMNNRLVEYVSEMVLHELELQDLRRKSENRHAELLDQFLAYFKRNGEISTHTRKKLLAGLEELMNGKLEQDKVLERMNTRGHITNVFQMTQTVGINAENAFACNETVACDLKQSHEMF